MKSRILKKQSSKRVKYFRKWLVELAGCVFCRNDRVVTLETVRMVYELMYTVEDWRRYDSFRVPRRFRGLWEARSKMERNRDGYVVSGEWPEFADDSHWCESTREWHDISGHLRAT